MTLMAKDGREMIWLYRNVMHESPAGMPCVLGHALDVTERIRTERALRQAKTSLKKAHDELAMRVAERTAALQEANDRLRARKLESCGDPGAKTPDLWKGRRTGPGALFPLRTWWRRP